MDGALGAEQLEWIADWAVGGIGVLCALIALRAASAGSWIVRIILGPVAVGSVLAVAFAVLVHRSALDVRETVVTPPPVDTADNAAVPPPTAVPTTETAAAPQVEPDRPPPAIAAAPPLPQAVERIGPGGDMDETRRMPVLFVATDRMRADLDGRTGFGSQRGAGLQYGVVARGGGLRAAAAVPPSGSGPDALSLEGSPQTRVEHVDADTWGGALAARLEARPGNDIGVVVVVDGYGASFGEAMGQGARLAEAVDPARPVIVFSWPTGSRIASYSLDRDSAERSSASLAEALQQIAVKGGARSVSFVCHGLGCGVVLGALDRLATAPASGTRLGDLVLVAPDLDAGDLSRRAAGLAGVARGITIYADAGDRGLDISRRFNGGVVRAGGVADSGPLVLPGVTTIDASGCAEGAVLKDIARLLATGERDPARRNPEIVRRTGAGEQAYWRFATAR